jgi:hypothetical protein
VPSMHRKHGSNGRRSRTREELWRSLSESGESSSGRNRPVTRQGLANSKQGEGMASQKIFQTTPPIVSPHVGGCAPRLLVKEKAQTLAPARWPPSAAGCRMAFEKTYQFEGPRARQPARSVRGPASADRAFSSRVFGEPGHTLRPLGTDQVASGHSTRDTTRLGARAGDGERRMGEWVGEPWYTITVDFDKDFGVDMAIWPMYSSRRPARSSAPFIQQPIRGEGRSGATSSHPARPPGTWEDLPEGIPDTAV